MAKALRPPGPTSASSTATDRERALCPELYRILREHFRGGVQFANEGESMQHTMVRGPDNRWQLHVHASGEYYRVNCPFCNDTRHRLWINHMFGAPDPDGRRMSFLAYCYNEQCMNSFANRRRLLDLIWGFRNANAREYMTVEPGRVEPVEMGPAEPPGDLIRLQQLPADHKAVQYMCGQRRYTWQMLDRFQAAYCVRANPRYAAAYDRIVFPVYFDGVMVGWQCRFIGDCDWGALNIPKYYTRPGMKKSQILYNFDIARHQPLVVVTEGFTDVHRIGDCGVALLGKTMSPVQRGLLCTTWPDAPIVLLLDPDAEDALAGIIVEITRTRRAPVVPIRLPDGRDPADYERDALWNVIHYQARQLGVQLPQVA